MTRGGATAPGAERHQILRALREQVIKHPAITAARGHPEAEYSEVDAELDPAYFGRTADSATLRITWYPIPDAEADSVLPDHPRTNFQATFKFHYSESTGYDCGFHNEPNSHVEGWFHFQDRPSPNISYDYERAELAARTPVSALWELLDKLEERLRDSETPAE